MAFGLVVGVAFLAYHVGEMRGAAKGRKLGYAYCLGERDDDGPARRAKL